jgi:hypothetical protein
MKLYGRVNYIATHSLDRDETLAPRSDNFTPRERSPRCLCLLGPRFGLDAVEKKKLYFICRESNPRLSIQLLALVLYPLSYCLSL